MPDCLGGLMHNPFVRWLPLKVVQLHLIQQERVLLLSVLLLPHLNTYIRLHQKIAQREFDKEEVVLTCKRRGALKRCLQESKYHHHRHLQKACTLKSALACP